MSFTDHNDPFITRLMHSKGEDDKVVDREVWRIIHQLRWARVRKPWTDLVRTIPQSIRLAFDMFKRRFLKGKADGRHRTPVAQGYGGANPPSSAGAGTAGGASPLYAQISATTRAALQAGIGSFGGSAGVGQMPPANPVPTSLGLGPRVEIPDAGIRAGEIIAYRCWSLSASTGLLHSMFMEQVVWEPDKPMEGAPDVDIDEGVHAFKDRLAVGDYGYRPHSGVTVVSGTVELWGMVIEHERGYRAQYAAIKSIDDSPFYDAKAIRKRYGLTRRRRKLDKPAKEV